MPGGRGSPVRHDLESASGSTPRVGARADPAERPPVRGSPVFPGSPPLLQWPRRPRAWRTPGRGRPRRRRFPRRLPGRGTSMASAANSSALPCWSGTVTSPPVVAGPAVPSPCLSPTLPARGPSTSSIWLVHRTIRSVDVPPCWQPRACGYGVSPQPVRRCRMVAPEDSDVGGHVHVNAGRLWAGGIATAMVAALAVLALAS